MKKNTRCNAVLAALALAAPLFMANPCGGAVLVDLNLSADTAANSGTFGNGAVNLGDDGGWTDRNETGSPSGRAFVSGANGMGNLATNAGGTVTWTHGQAAALDGASQFSFYMWIKPETTPGGAATLVSYGDSTVLQVLLSVTSGTPRLGVKINGLERSFVFEGLDSSSVGNWMFVGVSFDSGSATACVGSASDDNLATNAVTDYFGTTLNSTAAGLTLLNISATSSRPFDGALGGFELEDVAASASNLEAVFDAQKSGFIAIPEQSSMPMVFSIGMVGYVVMQCARRRRHRKA